MHLTIQKYIYFLINLVGLPFASHWIFVFALDWSRMGSCGCISRYDLSWWMSLLWMQYWFSSSNWFFSNYLISGKSWLLVGLNLASWILSVVSLASCTFIKLSSDLYDSFSSGNDDYSFSSGSDDYWNSNEFIPTSFPSSKDLQYGLFKYEAYDGSCVSYKGTEAKAFGLMYNKAGRAFGILQNLLLALSMIGILLVTLCLHGKSAKLVWLATKITYSMALLFSLLIFIVFVDCKDFFVAGDVCMPGTAGYINAANFFLVLTMSIWCCCVPVPSEPLFHFCEGNASASPLKTQPMDETSSDTNNNTLVKRSVEDTPQGRKILEEVTHPDGTKTITETLEEQVWNKTMMEFTVIWATNSAMKSRFMKKCS